MLERRQVPRNHVYYGGLVAFNDRNSTIACVVRNFNMFGAKIEIEDVVLVSDEIDFEIERKAISCTARLVWRNSDAAGLVFANVHEESGVVPLAWARKLRASERANRRLQWRLDQLLSEH
ncbi:PilZ domain-containing protein [Bradyrhizobium australiense]|uniref:Pilus assembly protein PilZ n=1 Tax=Bradyrhizobium australiense TaxID=2721161 RepID=A0A7Y4GU42_9BRAD|nr:PilZ domain-containing protein [Bradyrhizobium australiense]NOJ41921.1 pilus assembly protein PilZ [Bradyrhizobium australiense]